MYTESGCQVATSGEMAEGGRAGSRGWWNSLMLGRVGVTDRRILCNARTVGWGLFMRELMGLGEETQEGAPSCWQRHWLPSGFQECALVNLGGSRGETMDLGLGAQSGWARLLTLPLRCVTLVT